MGTWGVGTFENDGASDWVYDLEAADGPRFIASTLEAVTQAEGYLEAPACENALAAAEIIAALAGRPGAALPESVLQWVQTHSKIPTVQLKPVAVSAIDRILSDSELKELWAETDDLDAWQRSVQDLRARIAAA